MGETSDIVARPAAPIEPEAPPAPHGSAPAAVDAPRVRNRAQDTVDIVGTAETVRIRAVSAVRRSGWYVEGPLLLATVMFGLYAIMSIARFLRLDNGSWDLGMFTEAIKGYAHLGAPIADIRGPGFNLLGDHFHPILVLIAPFFRIFPSSITLLVAQAVLFAISMVPITRLAIRRLGIGAGYAIGIAYGLSWGLQSAADFDFHELAFAVPLLAFSLVALVDGRYRAAILWAMPLVLVKEDMGIFVAGIGVLVAIRGRKWWQGLGLSVFGLAASAVAILVFIPAFNPNGQYGFWQQIGGADPNSHPGMGGAFGIEMRVDHHERLRHAGQRQRHRERALVGHAVPARAGVAIGQALHPQHRIAREDRQAAVGELAHAFAAPEPIMRDKAMLLRCRRRWTG